MSEPSKPRIRSTGTMVRVWDNVAAVVITVGGLTVLAAMLGICIFLVASAAPLFGQGSYSPKPDAQHTVRIDAPVAGVRLDVRGRRAFVLGTDARLAILRTADGHVAGQPTLLPDDDLEMTAWALEPGAARITIGLSDGSVRSGTVDSRWFQVPAEVLGPRLTPLAEQGFKNLVDDPDFRDELARRLRVPEGLGDDAYIEYAGPDDLRLWDTLLELGDAIPIEAGRGPVVRVATGSTSARRRFIAAVREDGSAVLGTVRTVRRLDGGGTTERLAIRPIELEPPGDEPVPDRVFVTADGEAVLTLWPGGLCQRYSAAGAGPVTLAETIPVVEPGAAVTTASMSVGSLSLLIGDDAGNLGAWTVVRDPDADTPDRLRLARAHSMRVGEHPVAALGAGERDRTVALALADGSVQLRHVTSAKRIAGFPPQAPPAAVAIAPGSDAAIAIGADGEYRLWTLDPGHPDVSWRTLFGRVHYEGYDRPEFVYQSTGSAGAEPKYSMVPLIFGTLKATVVALLIAVPVAVMGAIYTSEFLHPDIRRVVKPGIELMATLPSVILGFIAAMLVAPYMRDWLPGVMVSFFVVPIVVMAAAHFWRFVPLRVTRRLHSGAHLLFVAGVIVVGIVAAALVGGPFERALFSPTNADIAVETGQTVPVHPDRVPEWVRARETVSRQEERRLRSGGMYFRDGEVVRPAPDAEVERSSTAFEPGIRNWLDGDFGGAWPGWLVLMMLPVTILVWILSARFVIRPWASLLSGKTRPVAAALEVARFACNVTAVVALASVAAWLLGLAGYDPRDSFFGPFSQRNTLVVGLIMGVAVIPIIYTISEDAMRSVPSSLRSASLGAGATPWQTAVRVVLPVAASGIFSACMIGLGRAVGETMIVLMATGNTPEMSLNIFSGFRTLAANIAVELPEAPRGGTHYRVLFLCGLVLFAMTLVINTTAELIRQHFRKRNASL